jgi:hypothetical protein
MAKLVKEEKLTEEQKVHLPVLQNTEKAQEIRLSGTAIDEAGKLTKHKYFEFLHIDLDDYSDLAFTPEEAIKIRGHLAKMSTGASSMVPMVCSPRCPFRDRCVFYSMGKAPFGRACLLEVNLLREWTTAYFNEYEVDPNNFTEVGMINELAEIEVYQWRLNMNLARPENAELYTENTVGITHTGDAITEKQLSIFLQAKQALANRKSKLIKLMVGDRQEKYKREAALKVREEEDPSSTMAELRNKLERLGRDLARKEIEIAAKAGQIIDIEVAPKPAELTADDIINSTE